MGMTILGWKSWKVFLIVAVITCVGLFSAFKLGVFTSNPIVVAKTTVLKPVSWEFVRQNVTGLDLSDYGFDHVSSSYVTDSGGVLNETIAILSYSPPPGSEYGGELLEMWFDLASSFKQGFMVDANVTFQENDMAPSIVDFRREVGLTTCENLTIVGWEDNLDLNGLRAFVPLINSNDSGQTFFKQAVDWVLYGLDNQTQALTINADITYFNGTVYEEVVQPFQLQLRNHGNTSFDTAEETALNQPQNSYVSSTGDDTVDYFEVWLINGTSASFTLNYLTSAFTSVGGGMEMRVYDPNRQLRTCIIYGVNDTLSQLSTDVNETGWWYVEVDTMLPNGYVVYTLTIVPT
jgi:hypothetical protein